MSIDYASLATELETDYLSDLPRLETLENELRKIERHLDRFTGLAEERHAAYICCRTALAEAQAYLDLVPRAQTMLDDLTRTLFGTVLDEVEANLTHAVREILGQERTVYSERDVIDKKLAIDFQIRSPEGEEHILTGQGGSVCNILSIALRLIALSRLDPSRHRPFIVLDEQDCWLKPDLVPRLVRLIGHIARTLNLQVLIISHHQLDLFSNHTDRIYRLVSQLENGVALELLENVPKHICQAIAAGRIPFTFPADTQSD
ncbi:conserved hypothetical protein [Desulfovibrionales bacterium]